MSCNEREVVETVYPAICCLGYNRKKSMKRLLESIGRAVIPYDNVTLIISIDQSDLSDDVEEVAKEFQWTHGRKIIKRYDKRLGVIEHTMRCGDLVNEYGAIIYLEDDIVVAPGFYIYTVEALKFYGNNSNVFGIGLYSQEWLPTYECRFVPAYCGSDTYGYNGDISWGQCWIRKQWNEFRAWFIKQNNNLKIDSSKIPLTVQRWGEQSWSRYLCVYLIESQKFYMVPYYSYTTCMSEGGMHTSSLSDKLQVKMSEKINETGFSFLPFDKCVKYDAYYDRMDKFVPSICGIPISEICIDLVGAKHNWGSFNYLLSTKKLKYKKIEEFSISLYPVEMNLIQNNIGTGIYLYQIDKGEVKYDRKMKGCIIDRAYHEIGKYSFKTLVGVLYKKIISRIK